jgi:hypothetical protein
MTSRWCFTMRASARVPEDRGLNIFLDPYLNGINSHQPRLTAFLFLLTQLNRYNRQTENPTVRDRAVNYTLISRFQYASQRIERPTVCQRYHSWYGKMIENELHLPKLILEVLRSKR